MIVTGGKDRVVKSWMVTRDAGDSIRCRQVSAGVGHENSVECLAVRGEQVQIMPPLPIRRWDLSLERND
jgi:hypothetical protein